MDTDSTEMLVSTLKFEKENVSCLNAFGPPGSEDVPFPLRWGEVVPLHFTKKCFESKQSDNSVSAESQIHGQRADVPRTNAPR